MTIYDYDIAFSYAGEDRIFVEPLANALKQHGVRVFYDVFEKSNLWGKNLYSYLSELYQNKARFCVMILSQHYANKLWTNHERQAAQARAFTENEEYILPIRLDNTEIPGILPTIAYLNAQDESVETIVAAILSKLGQPVVGNPQTRNFPNSISWVNSQPKFIESFSVIENDIFAAQSRILGGTLLVGKEESWEGKLVDDSYLLINHENPPDVKYFHFRINDENHAEATFSLDIKLNLSASKTDYSGAGLLYRFNRDKKSYYAFVLKADNVFSFYRRDSSGFKTLATSRSDAIRLGAYNNLTIMSEAQRFGLYINREIVKIVEDKATNSDQGTDIGIIAMSLGLFYFDHFILY